MRKLFLSTLTAVLVLGGTLSAQLTGVKNIPGDYATLDLAIQDLNLQGVGAGGVTLNMIAGNPETAPAGGYTITASGTAANTIVIQGNGNVITASAALTAGALNDAIFKIVGGDYVGINGFIMQENPANTTTAAATNNMTEWGVALLYANATNGAQFNAIAGNTISLNRTYTNTWGIYSNVRHTATAVSTTADITALSGSNSFNAVYGNVISNVNMGIAFIGCSASAFQDQGNDIGGSAAITGNTITNWGGASAVSSYVSNTGTSYCIFMNHQVSDNVSYNTLTSAAVSGSSVTFRGILKDYTGTAPTGTFTSTISNNTITMTSGFTSGTFEHIRSQGMGTLATATININNNTILNSSVTGASSSSALVGIVNTSAPGILNLNSNIISGCSSTATSGGFTGVSNTGSVVNTVSILNNQVGNASGDAINYSVATSGTFLGINNSGAANTCSVTISGNDIRRIVYNVASSATNNYIVSTGAALNNTISNNTYTNLSVNTTGTCNFISHSYSMPANGTTTISGNSIVTAYNRTGTSGSVVISTTGGSSPNTATGNYLNNNFSNITVAGSTSIMGFNNTDGSGSAPNKTITGNIFNAWTSATGSITGMNFSYWNGTSNLSTNTLTNFAGQSSITGISINSSFNGATAMTVSGNILNNFASSGTGGSVTGITCSNTSPSITFSTNTINTLSSTGASLVQGIAVTGATSTNVSRNKIYDLSSANAGGSVTGITVSSGTTVTVSNNLVGDLRATIASATNPVNGINITGGTTVNVYYNTIHLNATSSGTNFGSSGINASSTPTVNLRNNLVVNLSTPAGTGFTVAYRRSSTTLTTYANTSNNNSFYAGTPSATNLIFYDGTNSDQTLAAFQSRVSPRDASSMSENPTFMSLSGASANFLHIAAATSTLLESGGAVVSGLTIDYDNDSRPGPVGSVNGGAIAPDIGADEFDGVLLLCTGTPTAGTVSGNPASVCGSGTFTLSATGASSGPGITYQWQSSAVSGGPYTNVAGATTLTYVTASSSTTTYYVLTITCTNSAQTVTSSEIAAVVNAFPTISVTPTAATLCLPGGSPVTLTASGTSTSYAWAPVATVTPSTGAVVAANPTVTTTYTVTGTGANGCTATATATVTVANNPIITSTTASPASVCSGGSSQLQVNTFTPGPVNGYTFSTSTGAALDPMAGATSVISSNIDDTPTASAAAIGFTFNFNGTNYTQYSVSPDGWILLGGTVAAAEYTNAVTSTTNIPKIYPYWDDLATGTTGDVKTLVTGTAPNRIFIVQWFVTIPRNVSGAANSTFQAWLYEANGAIEFRYGTMGVPTSGSISSGLTASATNFNSITYSSNTSSTATANDLNTTAPASGRMYRFAPQVPSTYSWTPGTFLNSTTIANPLASGITSTTSYTTTVTSAAGCTATGTVTVTAGATLTSSATATPSTVCIGANVALAATAIGGGGPYTYAWTGPSSFSSTLQNPSISGITLAQAGTYSVTITDACTATSTATVAVVVNPLPVVAVTPTTGLICTPSGSPVTLTASGASTYTWSPTTGLTPTTGSPVSANPSGTTTYTVTGTDANGCVNTATATITVAPTPTVTATATPSSVCSGGSSQLLANAVIPVTSYNVTSIPFAPTTGTGTSIVTGDDAVSASIVIPFSFSYFGTIYTSLSACSNGFIQLGTSSGSTSVYGASIPTAATPNTIIAGVWSDLNIVAANGGQVITYVTGSSPNRVFTVAYQNVQFYDFNFTPAVTGNINFQIQLFETSNIVEVHVANSTGVSTTTPNKTLGIENSTGTVGTTPAGHNFVNWSAATAEAWRFTPNTGTYTYAWTPSTFLSATNVSNPMATNVTATTNYSVTATASTGCTATGSVTLTAGALLSSSSSTTTPTVCEGANVTLNGTPTGGGSPYTYSWAGPNGFNSTVQNPVINNIPVANSGTYTLTITDVCLATSTSSVTVTVNANPVVAVTPTSGLYCGSTPVALAASGATTYSWGPVAGLSATTGANVDASPSSNTTYTVTGTGANGCTATATTTITSSTVPASVTASSSLSAVCIGNTVDLSSSAAPTMTVLSQNFNSLGTWTVTNGPSSPAVSNWASVASPFSYVLGSLNFANFSTPNGGNFYMSNADAGGSGSTTNTMLTSPVFSTVGLTSASLTFEHLYQRYSFGDNTVAVEISTDGGITWSVLQAYTSDQGVTTAGSQVATTANISLASYLGQPNLRLRYNYNSSWGYYWILDNVVVSGNASYTYGWTSSPVGFTSTVQNPTAVMPTATTTYIVTVTNAVGCSAGNTVAVTVNALPTVVANSTASAVCDGSPVTLSGSGATSYTWTSSVTDNVAFTPTVTDTYTVTGTDGNGCQDTDVITVTVNALPTVVANSTASAVCDGSPVTLSGSGATSYTWTGSVTDNVAFTPTVTDTYTVTGTDGNGCQNTDVTTVTVNALPTVVANSTASAVCDGSPVTLSGSGATSYTWTGSVTDNVAFTPTVTDTYTVTGTDANGCQNTDVTTVTVNALPTVVANSTASAVCDGSPVTLSGSGATSYTWTGSVTDNVAFTPTVTDTYTVTGTDGNGCQNTDVTTVTVNALPTVVANSTASAVCDGSPVTLSGSGATSYTWTGSVTDNVAFTPTVTDTYTVTGTDGNGCQNTDMITVAVNALPTVVANSTASAVCDGSPVTLSGSGATSYTWTGSVTDNVAFTPTATDTYTVTGTDANGCMGTDSITVTVNALPNVTATMTQTMICVDDADLALTGGSPAGGIWTGIGVIGNNFDPTIPGAGTNAFTYVYTDGNGCSNTASTSIIVDLCTGVNPVVDVDGVNIYPNPNVGQFTIQLNAVPQNAVTVEIVNSMGQVIDAFTMTTTSKQVDLGTFAAGVYMVRITDGTNVSIHRVVRQ